MSKKDWDKGFEPELSPAEMLKLGVFGGAYFVFVKGGKPRWIPKSWWKGVKLSGSGEKEKELNYFGVRASQPYKVWKKKGWISKHDKHGWFEWYCRYYLGRRLPDEDTRQIKRWRAYRRHLAQVVKNCRKKDMTCRPKQRQSLLHWAYDSRKI